MARMTAAQREMKALRDEITALRQRVATLEARPPVVVHNHPPPPSQAPVITLPITLPAPSYPWKPGEVWCGGDTAPKIGTIHG